jgi:hypothetical protein
VDIDTIQQWPGDALLIAADRSRGAAAGAPGIAVVPTWTGVHCRNEDKSITIDPRQ